jgi:lipopolysaccharide export system protein LptA
MVLLGLVINNSFAKTIDPVKFITEEDKIMSPSDSSKNDTIIDSDISPNAPKFKVKYTANDSIDFDNANQIVYLYGGAKVEYDKISLEADFIKVYIGTNEVHAFSKKDSTGKIIEKVVFNDDGESFTAEEMGYNFTSKKGRITQTTTQQGEMYLLSEKGKKMPNDEIFLKRGKITTCDAEHPHFYFEATKLKVIPGKKIVVGPTNLIIRELRTPLIIPFGMFPNNQKQQSGVLIPGYASGRNGYGLEQLGYHWAINEYIHAEFLTDIYFSGTYRFSSELAYKKRYKYNGKFIFNYNNIVTGTKDLKDYNPSSDFKIKWTFNQEAQAHPKSKFSVQIDAISPKFNQTQILTTSTAVSTVQSYNSSSLNWRWTDQKWNLNVNSKLDQNFTQKTVDMTLPSLTFNMNPIKIGDFNISTNAAISNKTSRTEDNFFDKKTLNNFRNGAKGTFRIGMSKRWKIAKYINVTTPSLTWNSYLMTEEIRKTQGATGLVNDTNPDGRNVKYAYDLSLGNFGLNTKIYGNYGFKTKKEGRYLKGLRHTITPSATLVWRPDQFMLWQGLNDTITDLITGQYTEYSKYSTAVYRPNANKAASVSFGVDQNLQTKVRDRNDSTTSKYNTVNIINGLRVNSAYNFLNDSLNWSNLTFSLNTTPGFLRNLDIAGQFSPYAIDENGYVYDSLLWKSGSLGRLINFEVKTKIDLKRLDFMNWIYKKKTLPKDNFKWSLALNYTYRYTKPAYDATIDQSLGLNGSFQLSKNWSFTYNLPVNIKSLEFTSSSYFNFTRSLHCWEMTFNYFPFQEQTNYTFTIRPKAGLLSDLKYDKKRSGGTIN